MARLRAFTEKHRRRVPFVIFAVAALAHAHFAIESLTAHRRWDSAEYVAGAKSLAAGRGFRNEAGAVEARRTPGYPLFLAAFFAAGAGVTSIVAAQHLLAAALSVAVYFLALTIGGDVLAAAIAGLFVAIDSGQIYMADVLMTETATSVLLVAAVALLVRFARRPSIGVAAAAGAVISASVLVRPAAMYLWIPLLAWVVAAGGKRRVAAAVLFAAAALALPLLWSWRNYVRSGTASLSSIVGEILYYWRAAGAVAMEKSGFTFVPLPFEGEAAFRREFFLVAQPRFAAEASAAHARAFGARAATMTEAQLSAFDGAMARPILRAHLAGFALVTINGALHLLFDSTYQYANVLYGGWTNLAVSALMLASAFASVVLAAVGFTRLRRRDAPAAWLLAVVLVYFVVVMSGPENEQWRYRVPLIPLCAVLVGCSALPRRQMESGERAG
jgi:hypothetical protein